MQDAFSARAFDPAATAFAMAALPRDGRPVLWVQDRSSRRENGRVFLPGAGKPVEDLRLLRVEVSHPRDALWAMEEGAACAGLAAVVGEIHGAPSVLDFTATKRLALRAEASGVPVWLIRSGDTGGLSAARERWRIGSLPSMAHPRDAHAPGAARWDAELFRARGRPPGRWVAHHDPEGGAASDRLRLVSRSGDGAMARPRAAHSDSAGR